MNQGAIRAGKAFVEFVLDDSKFSKQLKTFQGKLRGIGSKLQLIGAAGAAASGAIAAGFGAAAMKFVDFGSQLDDMSQRTGVSIEALSELKYAAEQSGTTLDGVERGLRRMQANLGAAAQGTGTFSTTLAELNLTAAELQRLSPEQQFMRLSTAIAAVEDPTLRSAIAQKVFGRAGTELLPLMAQGTAGLAGLRVEAQALGVTMGTEAAQQAAALGDAFDRAKAQTLALAVQIGAAVAGPMSAMLGWFQSAMTHIIGFIREHQTLVAWTGTLAAAVGAVSTGLIALGTAFKLAAVAGGAFGTVLTFISAHPVIAALTAIAAGVAAVYAYFSDASDAADKFSASLDGVEANGSAVGVAPAEVASLQAQAAQLQASLAMQPAVQNVTVDQSVMQSIQGTLGHAMDATAQNTAQLVRLTSELVRIMGREGFTFG